MGTPPFRQGEEAVQFLNQNWEIRFTQIDGVDEDAARITRGIFGVKGSDIYPFRCRIQEVIALFSRGSIGELKVEHGNLLAETSGFLYVAVIPWNFGKRSLYVLQNSL